MSDKLIVRLFDLDYGDVEVRKVEGSDDYLLQLGDHVGVQLTWERLQALNMGIRHAIGRAAQERITDSAAVGDSVGSEIMPGDNGGNEHLSDWGLQLPTERPLCEEPF